MLFVVATALISIDAVNAPRDSDAATSTEIVVIFTNVLPAPLFIVATMADDEVCAVYRNVLKIDYTNGW